MDQETKISPGGKRKGDFLRSCEKSQEIPTEPFDKEERVAMDEPQNIQHFKVTLNGHAGAQRTAANPQLLSSSRIQLQMYELIPPRSAVTKDEHGSNEDQILACRLISISAYSTPLKQW